MVEGKLDFFCGALRSGKTSFAFELGLEHLIKGGTVCTNIKFHADVIRKWMAEKYGLEFDEGRLIYIQDGSNFWEKAVIGTESLHTMLIIDEAHVEHNARNFKETTSQETLFNTMVGKMKIHVVYITQDINNVDKQFRRLAQRIVYCRNLANFRFLGFIKFPFNMFFRVPYICGPGVPPVAQSPEITFRPISWGMFDTHHLVGRAQETFGMLKVAETSPLKRIQRPPQPDAILAWAPFAAALFLAVFL